MMPSSTLSVNFKLTMTSLSPSPAEVSTFSSSIVFTKGVASVKAATYMFVHIDDSYAREGVVVFVEGEDIIDRDVKVVIPV